MKNVTARPPPTCGFVNWNHPRMHAPTDPCPVCHPASRTYVKDLDYLRRVVAWANAQDESHWYGEHYAVPAYKIMEVYDAVHRLGTELAEIVSDTRPQPWHSYTKGEQDMVNAARAALGKAPFREARTDTLEGCEHRAKELGCTVESIIRTRTGLVLLCHRADDDTWITWRTFTGVEGFDSGRYDMTRAEGFADLTERARMG